MAVASDVVSTWFMTLGRLKSKAPCGESELLGLIPYSRRLAAWCTLRVSSRLLRERSLRKNTSYSGQRAELFADCASEFCTMSSQVQKCEAPPFGPFKEPALAGILSTYATSRITCKICISAEIAAAGAFPRRGQGGL